MSKEQKYNTVTPVTDAKKIITDLISISEKKEELTRFESLKIYGTVEDPLFQANDLGDMLQLVNIRYNVQKLQEGFDYIKSGKKTFITEYGFYKLIFVSRTSFAKLFQNFVCQILKKLRLTGSVNVDDMKKITQELYERDLQIEKLDEEKMELSGKCRNLNYYKQKLENDVDEYDKSNLSYLEANELKMFRERYYKAYNIYKTNNNNEDDNIEIFMSVSNKLTKYLIIDTVYLEPEKGFETLQFLMKHRIKDPKSVKKIKDLSKTSPTYEMELLSELYECVEESRYYDGDLVDEFE
jgi:prophage antirepressor-like protein